MLVCVFSMVLRGASLLLLHTYLYARSIQLCIDLISLLCHDLVVASNSSPVSTHAWMIKACCRFDNLDFISFGFTLAQSFAARDMRLRVSIFGSTQHPNILVSADWLSPNTSISSFDALFLSSNICMVSLMAAQPVSISSVVPKMVVSSAKRDIVRCVRVHSELNFPNWFGPGSLLCSTWFHGIPTGFPLLLCLFLSATRITIWWKMLNNTGLVGQPSLRPRCGIQLSLSPVLPLIT